MQARAKKSKKKHGSLRVVVGPLFMGVILGMLAKVAATQGMFDGVTDAATMDSGFNHFMPDLWD
jgi:hypothetical protein